MRILRVDGAPEETAYLRFSLKKVNGRITSVTLLLHPTTATRARIAIRRVAEDDWRERRLTYTNAPRPSSRYTSSKPVRQGVWSAIDVTPFVGDESGDVSLAITTRATRE
ncbi:MAG: DNRLRE domain-containing protein, partial [Actinomycetota bacterium]|nr:DNRLRE domain-containing protein [Actinomycetota bacterium]